MHPGLAATLALVFTLSCSGRAPAQQVAPDPAEIIRHSVANDRRNEALVRNYTYLQRNETHVPNKPGTSDTYELMILYGDHVFRHIAHNEQPLSPKEQRKEEERIQKIVRKRQGESEKERQERLAKAEKSREEGRAFVLEIPNAFDLRLVGEDFVDGRAAYVIEATPRPGYKPAQPHAGILRNFKGRLWIEKSSYTWLKVDAEAVKTVSIGWLLARVHPGSHLQFEQTWVNDEVWLPHHVHLKLDGRVLLVKGFNMEMDITFRDYRKFRVDTKVTSPAAVEPQ